MWGASDERGPEPNGVCIYAVSRVFTGDTRAPRATPPGGTDTRAPRRGNTPPTPPKPRARAGLLANSGCFVSKCVLWCFVVFCGCFVVFCGCFAVFCECFAVVPQNTQNARKTSKNTEKHKKTHNTLVYCGRFQRATKIDCIAQNTFHKTSAKHRKTPQNTAKRSQNAFCEITSQNTAKKGKTLKKLQNSRNTTAVCIARIRCILHKYFRPVAKVHDAQYA